MTFPTPWTVWRYSFTGTGYDSLGNEVGTWSPTPEDVRVIAYAPSMVESTAGHTSRVVSDLDMAVPPTLAVSVRDRFALPNEDGFFEVVAVEDANHGFHGWQPGSVVKLRRVTG